MSATEWDARRLALLAPLFQRLSGPTRLRVLFALADGEEHAICDLAAGIGGSRTTVSRHLGELARMGLVSAARRGMSKSYRLHPRVLSADGTLNLGRGVTVAIRPARPGCRA